MSRHEGVSCDACLRSNFRGRRYKCLICYDYDLCAICHEAGSTTTRHTADHPMQCILTRADFELFYGGEALSVDQPQSFACPHCGKMGLTELSLADHVLAQHPHTATQVVCPVCASVPNGEPNHVTEDLTAHLSMDHRGGSGSGGGGGGGGGGGSGGSGSGSGSGGVGGGGGGSRDLISFGDEPSSGARHTGRRMPHPGRGVSGPRIRRFNMHFRESMDPITELLSQLSGVRRAATSASSGSSTAASSAGSSTSTASQLQQLQMHLQLERQQYAQVVRQHSERLPRRQTAATSTLVTSSAAADPLASGAAVAAAAASAAGRTAESTSPPAAGSQFLLSRMRDEEELSVDRSQQLTDRIDRSVFAQEIVLSTLSKSLEECIAMSESETGASANTGGAAAASATSAAVPERPGAAAAPVSAASPAARRMPPVTSAPAAMPRPVGAAARSAAAASGRGGPLRLAGLVSVPSVAVGARVVPVRGRRKPARPATGAAVDGRPMPAAEPPPPPPPR